MIFYYIRRKLVHGFVNSEEPYRCRIFFKILNVFIINEITLIQTEYSRILDEIGND